MFIYIDKGSAIHTTDVLFLLCVAISGQIYISQIFFNAARPWTTKPLMHDRLSEFVDHSFWKVRAGLTRRGRHYYWYMPSIYSFIIWNIVSDNKIIIVVVCRSVYDIINQRYFS